MCVCVVYEREEIKDANRLASYGELSMANCVFIYIYNARLSNCESGSRIFLFETFKSKFTFVCVLCDAG